MGRNRAKTLMEVAQTELFLTSTDVRDGRLDPREAAIRVKGEALPDLYRCQGWEAGPQEGSHQGQR